MKQVNRDGQVWFIAETKADKVALKVAQRVLARQKIDHSFIYTGEPLQTSPIIEELAMYFQNQKTA